MNIYNKNLSENSIYINNQISVLFLVANMLKHSRKAIESRKNVRKEVEDDEMEEESTDKYVETDKTSCGAEIYSDRLETDLDLTKANFIKQVLSLKDPKNG